MILWLWLLLLRFLLLDTDGDSDGDDEDEDEGPPDDAGMTKNPIKRIESLLDANARLSRKLKKKDAEIERLKSKQGSTDGDQLRITRLETAFLRTVMAREDRIDAAEGWDLVNMRGFLDLATVDDDGEVTGMDAVLEKLLERYPWLLSDDDETEEPPISSRPSGRQPVPNPKATAAASEKALASRFPTLKRRIGKSR